VGGGFTGDPAELGAMMLHRLEPGAAIQPSGERGEVAELASLAGEIGEDDLRDVLGGLHVGVHLTERRGIHQVDMPPDQFRKRRLGTVPRKLPEQIGIGCVHLTVKAAALPRNRTN
jgi:hypothetical protein